ncbi:Outer membrane protein OmpA-like peptidoglycan-associated protein [Rahnella bruchi]|uniref:OmpA family protein n=1 Tax=Rahnella bruchi TaxID=1510573 RepID=UPI0039F099F5
MNHDDDFSKNEIDSTFLKAVSQILGEHEDSVKLAMSGIIPLLYDKVQAHLAWSKTPAHFLEMLRGSYDINTKNTSPSGLLEQTQPESDTSQMLYMLMPDQSENLIKMVSSVSKISTESSRSLVSVGAALLFSIFRKYLHQGNTQSLPLQGWMDKINYNPSALLPAAFINYLKGENTARYTFPEYHTEGASIKNKPVKKEGSTFKWLWLLLLAIIVAVVLLLKSCVMTGDNSHTAMQKTTDNMHAIWGDLGVFFSKALPDGKTITIPQKGLENKVLGYIEDNNDTAPTATFAFDRLLFEKNSSDLDPASKDQLSNIVEILKAYPNVHIKLNGYTDTSGTDEFNMKLSQDRANAVRDALVEQGAPADRLDAAGFGSANPVAANDTEANRAKNRRIEIQVSRK